MTLYSSSLFIPLLVALLSKITLCLAEFKTSFDNITHGQPFQLAWDDVDPKHYPLSVYARLINRTEGSQATGVMMNITNAITTGSTYLWPDVPYPLPYLSTGLYSVEIRSSVADKEGGTDAVVLAKSLFFPIFEPPPAAGPRTSSSPKAPKGSVVPQDGPETKIIGPTNKLALGLGLGCGIPSAIAMGFLIHVLGKRRAKILEEKRRKQRFEFVIH